MGSTYLELTNTVLRRLNEVELDASTFAGARGVHATAKDAVLATVRKINTQKFEWPFNCVDGTETLVISQVGYSFPVNFRIPDWESFYIENDGTESHSTKPLSQISKEDYWRYLRPRDLDAPAEGLSMPRYVFQTPEGGFGVSPTPDKEYILNFKYFIKTITLAVDSDVCTIPEEYNYVIEDGALEYMYLALDNAPRSEFHRAEFKRGIDDMAFILIPKSPSMTDTVIPQRGHGHFDRDFMWPYNN